MKVAVIANCDILEKSNIGVFKKMYGQIKAFLSYGMEVDFFYNKSYTLIKENINKKEIICVRPSSTENRYDSILKHIKARKYELIYIRYPISDYYFIKFLHNIKLIDCDIKLILDFPTYPYEKEIRNDKELLNIDKYFRNLLNNYIDYGTCYNEVYNIFDIPVYNIGNGIDVSIIKKKENIQKLNVKVINLIGVANISFWHGYDRVIKGLVDYYKQNQEYKVYFNIIGIGNELDNLMKITKENNLDTYVKFLGTKEGKELDKIFNICDIGIGSLGMYRKNLIDGSELKNREYCSRGIPFIYGYKDKDFSEDFKYAMKVSNDDCNININSVVEFYKKLIADNYVIDNMRKYAEDNLTWGKKMEIFCKNDNNSK